MKTFIEVSNEYAREFGYKDYYGIPKDARPYHAERIAKRYATEAIKEHLSRAAENAMIDIDLTGDGDVYYFIVRSSITNIEIELP